MACAIFHNSPIKADDRAFHLVRNTQILAATIKAGDPTKYNDPKGKGTPNRNKQIETMLLISLIEC